MEYVKLEGLDIEVSQIGLGTWAIGGWMWGGTDEGQSVDTILAAFDQGINLIDTAPIYGFGCSETIVGKALQQYGQRERVVVATKGGLEWSEDKKKVCRNSTPERLRQEVEDSLRRLQIDTIDLYQIHWPDPLVPFEHTAEALEKLRQEGKIRAAGVSNYDPEQMKAFTGGGPLLSNQPPYNLLERGIEADVLPYCRDNGVSVLAYGALCRGMLSGAVSKERKYQGDELRRFDPKFRGKRLEQYLQAVHSLDALAQERFSKRIIHLSVRWLLDQPGVTVALWGARRPEQLEPVADMLGWTVDADALQGIDQIIEQTISNPVGPGFMAPPKRKIKET
jgi:aryl-alcohol dehydrogenase-like predicted oxidoreductase